MANGVKFFAAKGSDRDDVVDDIVKELRAVKDDLSETLHSQVKTWYNNEIAQFRDPKLAKESSTKVKVKRYDAKSIAREENEERYNEIKEDLAGGTEWNLLHRATISKLWDELGDDEKDACAKAAQARNSGNLKEVDKRKLASAHANAEMASFVKNMYNIYGVRMVCLSSWTDLAGHAQTSVHETSISPKFSQQFPNWKTKKGVVNAFLEYSESFEDGDLSDDDEEGQTTTTKQAKYPWAQLDFNRDDDDVDDALRNYPILPVIPRDKKAGEWIGGGKIMIRAFVKEVHKLQTGSSTVPWSAMATSEGARALILSKCLPDGLGLRDPSRMTKAEVEAYYKLWITRQDEGKKALVFKEDEAKEKREEDRALRVAALKKRAYIEIDGDSDGVEENPAKSKLSGETESDNSGGRKKKKKQDNKQKANDPTRPRARPALKLAAKKDILVNLSLFEPYQSLVEQMLKQATNPTAPVQKIKTPAWASWAVDGVHVGPDFFDASNTTGHLSNWKAVLLWTGENPHVPSNESSFHHTEACDVLLIIGLMLRECKACAEAEPDSPMADVPFDFKDLEEVHITIGSMLTAVTPKKPKWGVSQATYRAIDSSWRKICLEVGLAEEDVQKFGDDWKRFGEAYAAVDCALMRSGKPPRILAMGGISQSLKRWVESQDASGNYPMADTTDWRTQMTEIWAPIHAMVVTATESQRKDAILAQDWCRRGRGGIVCLVLGMKWWRISIQLPRDMESLQAWFKMLSEMTVAFAVISGAESFACSKKDAAAKAATQINPIFERKRYNVTKVGMAVHIFTRLSGPRASTRTGKGRVYPLMGTRCGPLDGFKSGAVFDGTPFLDGNLEQI
ncbi:hypothetical protein B0H19DRAFT_1071214 [Mycena capillaripes]|nr:hypothetical protein B0H19DRAFT_1071214 [Mycena capillaripes]